MTFDQAVANTRILIEAAVKAGVQRFVHISITNPSEDSPLPYFRGKAIIERDIKESGLSYAILRPAVLFGKEGILINNIAWMLRRMPVFGIPGDGNYRLQPVFIGDLAALAIALGEKRESTLIDAVGPEAFTLNELVQLIRANVGSRTRIIHLPPSLALIVTGLLGKLMGDVILTREEIVGLMDNLLVSHNPPTGRTMLSNWLRENAGEIGREYQSEVKRHYR
jgi:NADH dehydrogenase